MSVTSLPKGTAQLLAARPLSAPEQYNICICGVIGSDGTATSAALYSDVQDLTIAQIKTLFGTNGELTNRILKTRALRKIDFSMLEDDLDDGSYINFDEEA